MFFEIPVGAVLNHFENYNIKHHKQNKSITSGNLQFPVRTQSFIKMSGLKGYLKAAKQALQDENPEYCIQLAEDALKIDPVNYFAYLFIGKSSHLLEKLDDAKRAYYKAIDIDNYNQNAWKGLQLIVKDNGDYKAFFKFAGEYAEVLVHLQEGLSEFIRDIRLYIKKYNTPEIHEEYLRSLLPESKLGQATDGVIEPYSKVIRQYLDIILKRENADVSRDTTRERLKSKNQAKIDAIAWSHYENSQISHLYEELINTLDDDEERRKTEEQHLKYKYKVLKSAPNTIKPQLFKEIKDLVEGFVLVKHTSFFAWSLYFDWVDLPDLTLVDESVIKNFLKLFKNEPLGQIIYAFVLSDLSPFQIDLEEDSKNSKNKQKEISQEEAELKELEADTATDALSPEEILALMLQGLESCKTSLIAYRIVISYQIHLKLFEDGLNNCQGAIQLLATSTRDTGFVFPSTKEDLLVDYGVILTYYQAPKNFKRALQIFDNVLKDAPQNVRARVGKGLILVERGDLQDARTLLAQVSEEFPDNDEATMELSWCQIRLGEYKPGRAGLEKVLVKFTGNSLYILELRASVYWKIAQSYLLDHEDGDLSKAYENLVQSLRASKNYAPAYTSLGEIYLKNYEDEKRATKCFLKAFEIDSSEVVAAWYLVDQFTSNTDWKQAEVFCKRLIESENSKRRLGNDSWPYRILGCASLELQDDAKAVEYFQNAIRLNAEDTESWIGLGEAYYGCGRLEAAVKVFKRALELEPNHWTAKYLLAVVETRINEFDTAIGRFEDLLNTRPDEECIISGLYDALYQYANEAITRGFFGKAIGLVEKAIALGPKGNKQSLTFWKTTSDLIQTYLIVQSKIHSFPHEQLSDIFKDAKLDTDQDLITQYIESEKWVELVALYLVYSNKAALGLNFTSRPLKSSSHYNFGLAQLVSYLKTKNTKYRDDAIDSLKEAIKLQSNYAEPWVALGVASISVNPRVAQHCFIKSTSIDPKNVEIWSNLALLYLRYDDSDLAVESYRKGQSLAPSEPISWLGHALAAKADGDLDTASNLFTHAFILSNGRSPVAQLLYGLNICLKRIGKGDDVQDVEAVQEISSASQGMLQYLKHYPLDPFGLSLTCLILEKLCDYELGLEISEQLLGILETSYEESENEEVLLDFARIKAQYARFSLGVENFDVAIEAAQECLELTEDDKTTISSRTVLGLAYFFTDNFDDALEEFKTILSLSNDAKRLVVLIAQILYIYDTEETKQAALDELFHNIETAGSSLLVTLVIGAISVIENLEDYLVIIKSELEALPLTELISDKFRNVPYLLSQISKKLKENEQSVWQKSAFLFPDDLRIWENLDSNISLKIASNGKVNAQELSDAYLQSGELRDIQRSLFISPWNANSVNALKGCF
ncbi:Superkiller protein 3 [Wickerhamomyces ciferrii]|uniref:Superkiller protein 3 n=1 Tax=Wickerhamomyces ciferrii (strain ATCC 14091 / BCRC 22168 / CBS 111 / JCM 3599 / NBRC 0793 / NRRL Y-1031 F-60-10) TaxID=1206466 RepID=K0KPK6_WICCF|nr:Superkiller protein 3 [Wickerhamomyces ciferrii]CCH43093.1 Superkiller protein 3 [Wickerhamomyces ciferrii]